MLLPRKEARKPVRKRQILLAEKDRYCVSNTCIGCLFLQVSRRREGVWRTKYEENARFFPTIDAYDVFIQDKALLFQRGEDHCFSRFGKEKIILHASFKRHWSLKKQTELNKLLVQRRYASIWQRIAALRAAMWRGQNCENAGTSLFSHTNDLKRSSNYLFC